MQDKREALPLPDKPSIAVLAFTNMSGDPEQEYFADGMVEEIITALSRITWLFVIARNSSFTYKGQSPDVKQVGRELGVRYVLEGSVRKGGGRVRITAQLIDADTGTHLWADRFDGSLEDVFDLQDKIATSVAGIIEPALQAAESRRSANRPTNDLTAYDLYLRALASFYPVTRERLKTALERIPIMLQYILHERRIWRHFGGQPSHELTDAAAKRIPETKSPAKTPPFRTPWKSQFNPNGNRSRLDRAGNRERSALRAGTVLGGGLPPAAHQ